MVTQRFDVFRNPSPRSVNTVPYVVVLQSELLDDLPTRVVAPLVKAAALAGRPATRLNPELEVEGETLFLLTQQVGAVPLRSLTRRVGSLEDRRDVIVAALDLLFSGI